MHKYFENKKKKKKSFTKNKTILKQKHENGNLKKKTNDIKRYLKEFVK